MKMSKLSSAVADRMGCKIRFGSTGQKKAFRTLLAGAQVFRPSSYRAIRHPFHAAQSLPQARPKAQVCLGFRVWRFKLPGQGR